LLQCTASAISIASLVSNRLRLLLALQRLLETGAFVHAASGVWRRAEQVCPTPHPCCLVVLASVVAVAAGLMNTKEFTSPSSWQAMSAHLEAEIKNAQVVFSWRLRQGLQQEVNGLVKLAKPCAFNQSLVEVIIAWLPR
jgi:hypothetical protein